MPCTFFIKQNIGDRTIVWSLNPSVTFGNPKNEDVQPHINMTIWMDKPFIYHKDIGWNWHKSWILPTICIKLEIIDPVTQEVFNPPPNTYAKLYAVKAATREISNFHLIDIGLKGNDKLSLETGNLTFQALKFTSTSYNNDGTKFNLVVAIIVQNENEAHPRIVEARISPPIFVDSRKSARDNPSQKEIKLSPFYELFPPEAFSKQLVKRKKKEAESIQEQISADIVGFTNYFTAPNIRNKIKHPFFLAYKFSECVSMYYNKDVFQTENINNIVQKTIEALLESGKEIAQQSKNKKTQSGIDKINTKAYVTLVLSCNTNNFMNKKVADLLGPVDNSIVNIIFDQFLPDKFVPIKDLEQLKKAYGNLYPKMLKKQNKITGVSQENCKYIKKNYHIITNFFIDSEEEDLEKIQKKVKTNKQSDIPISKPQNNNQSETQQSKQIQPNDNNNTNINQNNGNNNLNEQVQNQQNYNQQQQGGLDLNQLQQKQLQQVQPNITSNLNNNNNSNNINQNSNNNLLMGNQNLLKHYEQLKMGQNQNQTQNISQNQNQNQQQIQGMNQNSNEYLLQQLQKQQQQQQLLQQQSQKQGDVYGNYQKINNVNNQTNQQGIGNNGQSLGANNNNSTVSNNNAGNGQNMMLIKMLLEQQQQQQQQQQGQYNMHNYLGNNQNK
ncbi:hypothetical protein PPERSA_01687 [Pseudocohnilembus persalinus]|uniref:Uncharacterized protein n=1 Tax=Pseudocohnilembus persalinus TaxID=266149 RepID=A0A0V0R0S1_PSEPJ|nr:hypothetical protein PPERSA_01687 [Pseudocohnilembus persalinus]|eukprot:KRX08142.1 hypothetical protein PPERSA_01687 [Pseudocohnilembus persalinus]